MQHEQWQSLIPFYIAQTLAPQQEQAFEAHLTRCQDCQQEIDEWRIIASAVWREADSVAQNLPPLSQDVYNRLNYRDRPPSSRYSANPPRQQNRPLRQKPRQSSVPITMVAGITVALIFGALLIGLAMRDSSNNEVEVALQSGGGRNDITEPFGAGIGGGNDVTEPFGAGIGGGNDPITATPTRLGIIPTQITDTPSEIFVILQVSPSFTPILFLTNTPFQTPRPLATQIPPTARQISAIPIQQATSVPPLTATYTAQATPAFAPLGGGPYFTLTPGVFDSGAPLCEIFNPTNIPIEVFERADSNSQITGALMPKQIVRTIVISQEGWYFVILPSMQRGWISPQFAYLRGSCSSDGLWLATPTITPTVLVGQ